MALHSADHGRGRHQTDQKSESRHWSRMEKGTVMSTITIPRPGVTTEEVSEVLRRGLGPRYNVVPGKGMNWNPVGSPRADQPGKIVVGTGSTRLFRAQVTVSRDSGQSDLHVVAGGITLPVRLTNRLWIAEKVRRVLQAAPSLR
jgi:hypothetical protein